MRRVLVALAMIAVGVFAATPAFAQDDATGPGEPGVSNEATPSETPTEPAEDPPVPEVDPGSSPSGDAPESGRAPQADPPADDDVTAQAVVDQVTICHARSAGTNPYGPQAITVSVNSIFNPNNGHATHTGPVFPDPGWGDIIPPFESESGSFPGLNWTAEGQAIFFNDCQVPGDEEPPPPTENNVPICHATGSQNNPYSNPSPSVEGILTSHANDTGPVFTPGATEWGDIIPPFDFGQGAQFDGLNWDAEGQAIYFNNCNVPGGGDDDDDDGDDDGDDPDHKASGLPDTGGSPPWILLIGGLLTIAGIATVSGNAAISRAYGSWPGRHMKL